MEEVRYKVNRVGQSSIEFDDIRVTFEPITKGVEEYVAFQSTVNGKFDVAQANIFFTRYCVVEEFVKGSPVYYRKSDTCQVPDLFVEGEEVRSETWYEELPSGYADLFRDAIYAFNCLGVSGRNELNLFLALGADGVACTPNCKCQGGADSDCSGCRGLNYILLSGAEIHPKECPYCNMDLLGWRLAVEWYEMLEKGIEPLPWRQIPKWFFECFAVIKLYKQLEAANV